MTPPAPPAAIADGAAFSSLGGRAAAAAADLARLCRPRIAVMVLATVAAAAWITAGPDLDRAALAAVLLGTLLVAASSSVANQILERDTDRRMRRTAARPVASGRLGVREAWWITGVLLVAGLAVTAAAGGLWAAAAALGTWALYVVLYTPLKRVTPLNTAVGAVAGSLPVAIGWCAAGGPERLAAGGVPEAVAVGALATLLYLWQFPHFMAIAWLYRTSTPTRACACCRWSTRGGCAPPGRRWRRRWRWCRWGCSWPCPRRACRCSSSPRWRASGTSPRRSASPSAATTSPHAVCCWCPSSSSCRSSPRPVPAAALSESRPRRNPRAAPFPPPSPRSP